MNSNAVHKVLYEPKRVKVGKLIIEMLNYAVAAMQGDKAAKLYADSLARILMSSMYIKDLSWKHEQEYRIVVPIREHAGENIPINSIGLRAKRIIAGIHCSPDALERLAFISKEIGCADLYFASLSEDSFGIELKKYR